MALLQGTPLGRLLLSEKSDSRIDRSILKSLQKFMLLPSFKKTGGEKTYVAEKFFTLKNLIADFFLEIFSKYSENLF